MSPTHPSCARHTLQDLQKSVITPAPPLDCRVGVPCSFTLSMRTRLELQLPHGGLSVAVQTWSPAVTQPCTDMMNGEYVCAFQAESIAAQGDFDFTVLADDEEFEPIRTLVDPTTAVESTVNTSCVTLPLVRSDRLFAICRSAHIPA